MMFLLLIVIGVVTLTVGESPLLIDFAIGNNKFTAEVYRELLKSNSGNFLVCPLSAETILALVHAGSGGQTSQQLSTALHLPRGKNKIKQIFQEVVPRLRGNQYYNLNSANKLYVKNGYRIKNQFKTIAVNVFDAEIQNIDFERTEEAASAMNRWVKEKTEDKINNLIKPDDLTRDTRAILINAMYFHGKWVTPFHTGATTERSFYLSNNHRVQVGMMDQTSQFKYYESSELNAKFLELPYEGEDITMTLVLPNDKEGLSVLESRINDVFVTPKYSYSTVHVAVPKFKIESTIDFKPILQSLGVVDAFENTANFREILIEDQLKISKVIQKTFIEVEEKGTKAAAATAVHDVVLLSAHSGPSPMRFIADHPFIFYVKIKDIVCFAGRYSSGTN